MMSVASSNSKNSPRKVGSRTYYSYSTLYCMNYAPNVLPANEGEHPSTQRERWNNFSRGEHDKQGWIPDLMMTTTLNEGLHKDVLWRHKDAKHVSGKSVLER